MSLFKHNDPMNQNHVNDVGQEMRDRGSKEKTGYMEKEAEFSKQLKNIQTSREDSFSSVPSTSQFLVRFGCFAEEEP